MKTFITFIICWLSALLSAFGQITPPVCPPTYTHTEPWNWWAHPCDAGFVEENWAVYMTVGTRKLARSPFVGPTGCFPDGSKEYENTLRFCCPSIYSLHNPDCYPEDGWVCIDRRFGTSTAPESTPTFVLYNRFTGVLRIFIFTDSDHSRQAGIMEMRHILLGGRDAQSALFSNLQDTVKAIDRFEKNLVVSVANKWNDYSASELGQWFYAEVPLAYDPCVCKENWDPTRRWNHSIIQTELTGLNTSSISLISRGRTTGTMETIINGPDATKPSSDYDAIVDKVGKVGKHAKRSYDAVETFTSKFETGEYKHDKTVSKIPKVAFGLGLIDYFISGGQKESNTSRSSSTIALTTNDTIEGEMETATSTGTVRIYTPGSGSFTGSATSDAWVPRYNYPLGVINLMATPVLEYVDYERTDDATARRYCYDSPTGDWPTIRQYHLRDPLQVVLNPMAGVRITDLRAEIVYTIGRNRSRIVMDTSQTLTNVTPGVPATTYPYGPLITRAAPPTMYGRPTSFAEEMDQGGVTINSWPIPIGSTGDRGVNDLAAMNFSTGVIDATCMDQTSIFLSIPKNRTPPWFGGNNHNYEPRFAIRIYATMERLDATANTEPIQFINLYHVEVAAHPTAAVSPLNRYLFRSVGPEVSVEGTAYTDPPCGSFGLWNFRDNYVLGNLTSALNPGGPAFALGNMRPDRPSVIYIPDGTVFTAETTITASRGIIIGNNVSSTPGSRVTLIAPNWVSSGTFDFQGEFDFRRMSPEDADTWVYGPCGSVAPSSLVLPDGEISLRCRRVADYNPFAAAREGAPDDPTQTAPTALLDIVESARVYPNPFTDNFTLDFQLKESALVTVELTNALGQTIRTCCGNVSYAAGVHSLPVDGRGLAPGTYFAKIMIDGAVVKTVPLMKVVE
jgi:hypothetical protein